MAAPSTSCPPADSKRPTAAAMRASSRSSSRSASASATVPPGIARPSIAAVRSSNMCSRLVTTRPPVNPFDGSPPGGPDRTSAASARRSTFSIGVRGSSSTTTSDSGSLNGASRVDGVPAERAEQPPRPAARPRPRRPRPTCRRAGARSPPSRRRAHRPARPRPPGGNTFSPPRTYISLARPASRSRPSSSTQPEVAGAHGAVRR